MQRATQIFENFKNNKYKKYYFIGFMCRDGNNVKFFNVELTGYRVLKTLKFIILFAQCNL